MERQAKKQNADESKNTAMLGRGKRFSLDRFQAILDYFIDLLIPHSQENSKLLGHSLDYFGTLNSLAEQDLLKRFISKKVGSNGIGAGTVQDLTSVNFKVNYDLEFVVKLSAQIGFPIDEYLSELPQGYKNKFDYYK